MGYTTDFDGFIEVIPALSALEIEFLNKFSDTRRMDREKGPYYIDGGGFGGQDRESDVRDYNNPPEGQPGLWCQWVPNGDGTAIEWDGKEKFYDSPEWMAYLIKHFLGTNPLAKAELPFLQGHTLNGTIAAQGEDPSDMWLLHVVDNQVSIEDLVATPTGETHIVGGATSAKIGVLPKQETLQESLTKIAIDHRLVPETLETRNSDSLDFHECAVWNITGALEAAYNLGLKKGNS